MKKKKTIVINNSQLSKIRNSLRMLLIRWANIEWDKLKEKERAISYDENGKVRHPNSYSGEEKSELHSFRAKMTEIFEMVDKSICKCFRCVATDKNMTYNPIEKAWFCFQCYEELKQWTAKKKTGISMRFP